MEKKTMKTIEKVFSYLRYLLGKDIDMYQYEDRFNLQKLTYLLQSAGLDFSYLFGWYIKGPYSPKLASEAFRYVDSGQRKVTGIPNNDKEILDMIKLRFSGILDDAKQLELYASLLFIKNDSGISLRNEEKLSNTLLSLKPWFKMDETIKAIKRLKEAAFL